MCFWLFLLHNSVSTLCTAENGKLSDKIQQFSGEHAWCSKSKACCFNPEMHHIMELKRVGHGNSCVTTFWRVLGLHTDLTSNDLKGVSLGLSSTCVHFPRQHVERWTCQPIYRKRLLSTWAIYCEEQPLSHQKPSSCPERQWGCRGHFSRTETCQLKIYSAGVMEKALIQFALINLKQWLTKRGKNRGEAGTGCTHT